MTTTSDMSTQTEFHNCWDLPNHEPESHSQPLSNGFEGRFEFLSEIKIRTDKFIFVKSPDNAGTDIRSAVNITLEPGKVTKISTGIYSEFPDTMYAQIASRSGLASKGIFVLGGVLDSSYRGEWLVMLYNSSDTPFIVSEGDRIAQVIFYPIIQPLFVYGEKLNETDRGTGGFGSTGMQ